VFFAWLEAYPPPDQGGFNHWARSFPVNHINLSRKAEKQCKV